jgi:hypothetical protein
MNGLTNKPDLDKLDALHAASTQGEWWEFWGGITIKKNGLVVGPLGHFSNCEYGRGGDNATCAAALHNAWPAISKELRNLYADRAFHLALLSDHLGSSGAHSVSAGIDELVKQRDQLRADNERLVEVGHKHGWNGVENSKILATFFDDVIGQLRAALEYVRQDLPEGAWIHARPSPRKVVEQALAMRGGADQHATLTADNNRLRRALEELKSEYEGDGAVGDVLRRNTYKWSLTRIHYALSAPPPDAVKRYEAKIEIAVLDKVLDRLAESGTAFALSYLLDMIAARKEAGDA